MKTLAESLFDKDLVTKDIPILDDIKNLTNDSIRKMSVDEILDIYNSIIELGTKYSAREAKKLNIDITKNVVILSHKKEYRVKNEKFAKYEFLFGLSKYYGRMYGAGIHYTYGYYEWTWDNRWDDWGHCPWSGTVDLIEDWCGEQEYIVLPEIISQEIIKLLRKIIY